MQLSMCRHEKKAELFARPHVSKIEPYGNHNCCNNPYPTKPIHIGFINRKISATDILSRKVVIAARCTYCTDNALRTESKRNKDYKPNYDYNKKY